HRLLIVSNAPKNEPALAGKCWGDRLCLRGALRHRHRSEASCVEDRGVAKNLNLKTGTPDEPEAYQRSSPPYARGHGRPPIRREDATRLYPTHRDLRHLSRPLARLRDRRRSATISGARDRAELEAAEAEHAGCGAAVSVQDDARTARSRASAGSCQLPTQAAASAEPGGRGPAAGGGTWARAQVQGCAECHLWRGAASQRGRRSARRRYR